MKRTPGRSFVALASSLTAVLMVAAAPDVVRAQCPTFVNFGQQGQYCSGATAPCFITSPGHDLPETVLGTYWAVGHGDPSSGVGIDNGSWDRAEWLEVKAGGLKLKGDWHDSPAIDGCISGAFVPGTALEVMAVAVSDTGIFGYSGFFAVAAVKRGMPSDTRQFDFGAGLGEDIAMAPIPAPVVFYSGMSQGHQYFQVVSPSVAQIEAGFYSDGSVELDDVVAGYRVYQKTRNLTAPPASTRLRSEWTPATGVIPLGQSVEVDFSCADYYIDGADLALSIVFDSGFETEYVSANSYPLPLCTDCAIDEDHDGYCEEYDCDDFNSNVFPYALERNDGFNNSCGNTWVDELEGAIGFYYPGNKSKLSWQLQPLATVYEVLRTEISGDSTTCTTATSAIGHFVDPDEPLAGGGMFRYLVRPLAPHPGSLGGDSTGVERSPTCP